MKTTSLIFASIALASASVFAAPVEYDTPDAHIVVIRPMDQWIPDASLSKNLDKDYFKDEYMGQYSTGPKEYFTLGSDEPFAVLFRAKYPNKEFTRWRMSISTGAPMAVKPSDMSKFIDIQNGVFELSVLAQGDPKLLSDKINTSQIWRNVLTIATIGVAGAGGGNLASAIAGSTLPSQIGQISTDLQKSIIGVRLKNIDYSKYKTIDVRTTSVSSGVRIPGQIIIAYKKDKTQSAEDEALVLAIGSTLGFDTTKEATMASRAADLADRQAIWDKCVADGKCKEE